MGKMLQAGAGKAPIKYTMDMLPTLGENYNAIHDLPYINVLLLEADEKIALITVDVVMLEIKQQMSVRAAEILGIPEEKILIQATHVLATPHFKRWASVEEWKNDFMHRKHPVSDIQAVRYMQGENAMTDAHMEALETACQMAAARLEPVKIGIGTAQAKVNVNRVVETKDGWWQGVNQDGLTDHSVPVILFDDLAGNPKVILFNCNVAPGCMEFSETNGGRMVSGDLSGAAKTFIDSQYDEAVSIYTTGVTGDQWQALRARKDYIDRDGNQRIEDLQEAGFILVDILATRLGEQVIKTADAIVTEEKETRLALDSYEFSYDGQKVSAPEYLGPTRDCTYTVEGKVKGEIKILQINDTAIIACGVEMGMETWHEIKKRSPYKNTFLMEFTTEGGGYMPEEIFYDRMSYQSRKSRYAKGSAEKMREDIIEALNKSYEKHKRK